MIYPKLLVIRQREQIKLPQDSGKVFVAPLASIVPGPGTPAELQCSVRFSARADPCTALPVNFYENRLNFSYSWI